MTTPIQEKPTQDPKEKPRRAPAPPKIPVPVGLDVGYGYVKISLGDQSHTFPSLVAPLNPGEREMSLQDHQDIVEVDDQQFLVGPGAAEGGFRFREQYDAWWGSPTYKALLTKASQFIPKGACIVTGLPLHLFIVPQARQQVATLIKHKLHAKSVTVLCQGIGALASAISRDASLKERRIAIADIGTRTTELIGMAKTRFLKERSRGLVFGVAQIFEHLAAQFTQTYGRSLDPYEIDTAYRNQTTLTIRNITLAPKDLHDRLRTYLQQFMDDLHEEMVRTWDIANREESKTIAPQFDLLLFCGGGAPLLEELIKERYPHAHVMPHAHLANAEGYWHMAANQLNAHEPSHGATA